MRRTIGIRLVQAYNALFAWRRRREQAGDWSARAWDDEQGAIDYARWRHRETDRFLSYFRPIDFAGRTVLDFGCSHGGSALLFAERGAGRVIGVDVAEPQLRLARQFLAHADPQGRLPIELRMGSHDRTPVDDGSIDLLMCNDVVEHLLEPEQALREWRRALRPDGRAYVTFGPLWYHPHGVHLWELFPAPWTHVLFPERTVVRTRHWLKRDDLDPDVVSTYRDLGFNRMTVGRFLRLLRSSGLVAESLELVPMKGLRPLVWLPLVRELFVSEVRCVLRRADAPAAAPAATTVRPRRGAATESA